MNRTVRQFSDGYLMLDAEAVSYNGEDVIMPHDLFSEATNHVTRPLLRIGNAHYWARPEQAVPADTIAMPGYIESEHDGPVLLAKDGMIQRLITVGEASAPT